MLAFDMLKIFHFHESSIILNTLSFNRVEAQQNTAKLLTKYFSTRQLLVLLIGATGLYRVWMASTGGELKLRILSKYRYVLVFCGVSKEKSTYLLIVLNQ